MSKKYDVIHIGEANLDITVPDVPDEFFTGGTPTGAESSPMYAAEMRPIRRCVSRALVTGTPCSGGLTTR